MGRSRPGGYEPRPLSPADLRTPVTAALRRLPAADREDLLARRQAQADRLEPTGAEFRTGLVRRAVVNAVAFYAVTWLLIPVIGPFDRTWLQVLLAFAFGFAVSWWRPAPLKAGLLMLATGATLLLAFGWPLLSFYGVMSLFIYGLCGMLAGVAVGLAASDGA